jgi:hypothetical protein
MKKKRIRLTYRRYRITLVREGRRHWRSYVTGPSAVGGLSMAGDTCPVFWALMDAIWAVQDKTRGSVPD